MEKDQNNTHLDEIKLYQNVIKTMMSKVKSSDTPNDLRNKFQLIETVAISLQELFALGDISEDVDKMLTDNEGSHDVPPSKRVAREQGSSKRVAREQVLIEGDKNNNDIDEIKLYQKVMKAMLSQVKSSDTTAELKAKFQSIETVAGNLRDLFSLENLPKEEDIGTERKMQIHVEISMGKTCVLDVKEGDTVHSVKTMIQDLRDIPAARQTLVFGGKALQDIDTLLACNIKSGSILHVILEKEVRILITSPEGEHDMYLHVRKGFTVWDVKTMITSLKRIPQENLKLACDGKQLTDFVTLADCNLDDGYKLKLTYSTKVFHPIKIVVQKQSGAVITYLNVHNGFGVYNLKKVIEDEDGIPADQQRLFFSGRMMDDSKTLEDYKVEDGSKIVLMNFRGS